MSAPFIAFFINKGGVGKTSLVYHPSWMYADLGTRMLACDPEVSPLIPGILSPVILSDS